MLKTVLTFVLLPVRRGWARMVAESQWCEAKAAMLEDEALKLMLEACRLSRTPAAFRTTQDEHLAVALRAFADQLAAEARNLHEKARLLR